MKDKTKSRTVYCRAKQREVQVEYKDMGTWYSPDRELVFCPAVADGGESCTHQCLKELHIPISAQQGDGVIR